VSSKPTLFVLLSRFPFPLIKGDKLRAYHQIRTLAQNFEIHLVCISDEKIKPDELLHVRSFCSTVTVHRIWTIMSWCNALRYLFSAKPAQVGYFYRYWIQRKINRQLKQLQPNHLYCQLVRVAKYVLHYHESKKTIDFMDALSKGIERRIELAPFYSKWIFKREHFHLLHFENLCFDYFDSHTIISEVDRNFIYHSKRDQIQIVRNGVDQSHFEHLNVTKDIDVIFTGNMGYAANIEAVHLIHKKILPLLIEKKQDIKLLMVGASMPMHMIRLSNENINFQGWVEDLRTCIQRSKTYLAPMTIGTGLQNKLLEAMAAGTPAVTTSLCNGSLHAVPSENILIAETENEMTDQILALLNSTLLSDKIASNAIEFVKSNYSWEAETVHLANLFTK
jgi:polysaccharide biosynthesis protein PslH